MSTSYAPGIITITSSTAPATAFVEIDNGGSVPVRVTAQNIANLAGASESIFNFTTQSATSTQTVTLSALTNFTAITLTQTAAALTVQMPAGTPVQGQRAAFTLDGSVTALTLTASTTSQTIDGATGFSATTQSPGAYGFAYNVVNTTWYRSV